MQLFVIVLMVTALQATRPIVTYRAIGLGAGPFEIGLVQSAFSLLPVLTAVAIGRWIDRVGEARFLVVAVCLFVVGNLVLAVSASLLALSMGLVILGFGQIIHLVAGQAMIANYGPRDRREHRYGWYSTSISLGQLSGPTIGAALAAGAAGPALAGAGTFFGLSVNSPQAPVFIFSAVLTLVALGPALFLAHRRRKRPEQIHLERAPNLVTAANQVLRRPGMMGAMLVSIVVLSSVDVLIAYLPAYGEAKNLAVQTVGALLSVRAGSSLVSRMLMGWLIDRIGRGWLLATSMALAGVGFALLPFANSELLIFGIMVMIGLGVGLGQPMTIAWVANRSPRQDRALALGVRVTGNRAALLVIPTVMGAIAGAGGLALIWVALAALLGFGAIVAGRTPFDGLDAERRPQGSA